MPQVQLAEKRASTLPAPLTRSMVGDVRGRGCCLQGIELVRDRATKKPASAEPARVLGDCLAAGLLFSVRGPNSNVLRFVLPFTTNDADLDEAADILEEAIAASV